MRASPVRKRYGDHATHSLNVDIVGRIKGEFNWWTQR